MTTIPAARSALFSGHDYTGWVADNAVDPGNPDPNALFTIVGDCLVSRKGAFGHLITEHDYSDYVFSLDYRLPATGGNGSVLVHVSDLDALRTKSLNRFPKSIEFKIRHRDAGDVYCVQEDICVADMEKYRPREPGQKWGGAPEDARHIDPLADAERPAGEWNHLELRCSGRTINAWLNGVHIFDGFDCTADHGRISLQAGGDAVEFKSVMLGPLV